jgi:general secretion pathway protein A
MNEKLYSEDPFSISPNPLYLYLTPSLKATLHKIRYTINRRQGLTCVLGDVGYGKSTVLRFMYTEFDANENVTARLISSPNYTSEFAFLKSVSGEFDVPAKRSIIDQERELKAFLIEEFAAGRNVALFIDEAQRLSNKMLEIVRSMLNFETDDAKLIQIVLSGQLELRDRLVRDDLKAIESRIVMPTVLNALSPGELVDMIEFRCRQAEIKQPFTPAAFQTIYEESGGIPRDALKICATAYEYMRMAEETEIDPELITAATQQARLKPRAAAANE